MKVRYNQDDNTKDILLKVVIQSAITNSHIDLTKSIKMSEECDMFYQIST